jgi:hypothetical protein
MSEEAQILNCPACGASITPPKGQSTMQCPFCHNTIKIPEAFLSGGKHKKLRGADAGDKEEEDKKSTEDPLIGYLESQADIHQRAMTISAGEKQPPHAWGGSQPTNSVSVPAGFEGITTLGPVVIVCDPQRVHPGAPRISRLVVYRDGFAYQAGGTDVHAWRFDEMTAIWTDEEDAHGSRRNNYVLVRAAGQSLIMDTHNATWADEQVNFQWAIQAARDYIKLGMFKLLLPIYLQHYEAGETIAFGPVMAQKSSGLQLEGRRYAWNDIKDVRVSNGQFQVTLSNNQQTKIRVSKIPNFELMCRLIGLDMTEMGLNLKYWA